MEKKAKAKILSSSPRRPIVTTFSPQNKTLMKNSTLIKSTPNLFKQNKTMNIQRPSLQESNKKTVNTQEKLTQKPLQQNQEEGKNNINSRRFTITTNRNITINNNKYHSGSPLAQKTNQITSNNMKQIQLVNDNIVKGVAFKTACGKIPGMFKKNQDSIIVSNQIKKIPYLHFYGVSDGHGEFGGEVSQFIKAQLPNLLSKDVDIETDPVKALNTCINKVAQDLSLENFDVQLSGSTLVSVLIQKKKLLCANVGDSRAILVKKENCIALSRDHKPDLKDEADRIISKKGRIMPFKGPLRVWLQQADLPGLAMTRSIGDVMSKQVGVIKDPEIMEFELTSDDLYIVIASDGVWEFLSNEEVVKITKPLVRGGNLQNACDTLVRESTRRWREQEETIDDITCVIVQLHVT